MIEKYCKISNLCSPQKKRLKRLFVASKPRINCNLKCVFGPGCEKRDRSGDFRGLGLKIFRNKFTRKLMNTVFYKEGNFRNSDSRGDSKLSSTVLEAKLQVVLIENHIY